MTRFPGCHDHINPYRMDAGNYDDSQHLWLTVLMSDAELAQILRDAMENYDDVRAKFLEITRDRFDKYTSTRGDE